MVGGRREDVEDAATDRELAAASDHVHTLVGHLDELGEQAVEVDLDALAQGDRGDVSEARRHRLHE